MSKRIKYIYVFENKSTVDVIDSFHLPPYLTRAGKELIGRWNIKWKNNV